MINFHLKIKIVGWLIGFFIIISTSAISKKVNRISDYCS